MDEIKKIESDPYNVRFSFLDFSQVKKKVLLRVIDYNGDTKTKFGIPET